MLKAEGNNVNFGDGAPIEAGKSPVSFSKVGWSSLLSLLVLGLISYVYFEPAEFIDLIRRFNGWFMTAAFLVVALRVFFGGWRLSFVSNNRLNLVQGIRAQLAWDFFSNVSPSAIGGGPFAAVYVAHDRKIKVGEATGFMLFAILMDQFFFALTIICLLALAPFIHVFPPALGAVGKMAVWSLFAGMMVWVAGFGYAVLFRPDFVERFIDMVFRIKWLRRYREKVASEMTQFTQYAQFLRSRPPGFYVKGFALTCATWLSRFMLPLLIVWSVFPALDKDLFLVRIAAMTVGSSFLPTPGGSGGIEWLYVLFLGPPMMPKSLVAPTLLVWRVLGYYLFLGLGVFLSMHQVQKSMRRKKPTPRPRIEPPTPVHPGEAERVG